MQSKNASSRQDLKEKFPLLSDPEIAVLLKVGMCKTNREIGKSLRIPRKTVKIRIKRLNKYFGVHNKIQLALIVAQEQLPCFQPREHATLSKATGSIDRFLLPEVIARRKFSHLTDRQIAVLLQLAKGKHLKDAGRALGISEARVSQHLRVLLSRLGVRNRCEAVLTAFHAKLPCFSWHSRLLQARVRPGGPDPFRMGEFPALTIREGQVCRGIQEGLSDAEIGKRLNCKEKTVRLHLASIRKKLGMRNRTDIAKKISETLAA